MLVDTSGLENGRAQGDASTDVATEASGKPGRDASAFANDAAGLSDAAGMGDDAGMSDTGLGGACRPLDTSCSKTDVCCVGLQCGDARKCLSCLPNYDNCTSNAQCCSHTCDPNATICL